MPGVVTLGKIHHLHPSWSPLDHICSGLLDFGRCAPAHASLSHLLQNCPIQGLQAMKPEHPLPWRPSPGHNRPEKECSFILGWPSQHRRGPKEPGWKVCTLSPLAGLYMFEQALGTKYGEGTPPSFMGAYTRPTQALGSPAI